MTSFKTILQVTCFFTHHPLHFKKFNTLSIINTYLILYENIFSLTIYENKRFDLIIYEKINILPPIIYKENKDLILIDGLKILKKKPNFLFSENKYGWKTYTSRTNYSTISPELLYKELFLFLDFFTANYKNIHYLAIIFKIRFENNDIRSCSTTQVTHIDGINALHSIFSRIFYVENFAETVSTGQTFIMEGNNYYIGGNILFSFKPLRKIKGTKYEDFTILSNKNIKLQNKKDYKNDFKYKDFTIPATMDLHEWPNITFSEKFTSAFSSVKSKDKNNPYIMDFVISIDEKINFIDVRNKDTVLFTIEDILNNPYDLTDFKRVITENDKKKIYYFKDGEVKLYSNEINTNFITKIPKDLKNKLKILTLDFETRDIPYVDKENPDLFSKKVPIAVSVYDGYTKYSYIFKDLNTWAKELALFIKTNFMKRKFDYYKVYVHNFSYFDAIFIIDSLTIIGDVKPVIRNNNILKLIFSFKVNEEDKRFCRIIFYDSNLIFQSSLRKLSQSFAIKNPKTYFPFGFMNKIDLDFNYNSSVPKINDFLDTISEKDYEDYCLIFKNKPWNFINELTLYCENDTIALFQIIKKFYNEIYTMFKIDITKYPTLPSIAFAIYRANYLEKEKIPIISGKLHYILKESYFGGITEAYKPCGKVIHSYDVNSLYPYTMSKFDMPIGKPVYFSGDISLLEKGDFPFGFFRVKVKAPLHIKCPALPLKYKVPSINSIRTLFPVGEWEGWYFSEEIKDKIQQGYSFKVEEGYLFEKENLFKEYIDVLYKMKSSVSSDDPKYFISKLLMNSLYGRFGLNPEEKEVVIVSNDESENIVFDNKNVIVTPLLNGKVMISYDKTDSEEININNISVPISSAIASYSRITMNNYLIKYSENIYAIDTDGIKIDKKLENCDIDPKILGKMKYEYTFKEAIFPAPKVYGGLLLEPYKGFDKELVKIKGLKNPLDYESLKTVLDRNASLIINQEKWIRKLSDSAILVKNEDYTLEVKESKRELIYNPWGDLVATLPFKLVNNRIEMRRGAPYYSHLANPFLFYV